MRLGLISDVHGDAAALADAFAQMERLGVDAIVCAGDVLDWGPSPGKCLRMLRDAGVPCVRGNHDYLDAGGDLAAPSAFLPTDLVAFVDGMPHDWAQVIDGVRVRVVHGVPGNNMRGVYPDYESPAALLSVAQCDVLVVGHTHRPMEIATSAGLIVNPGSVLRQPIGEAGVPATGTFGILDLPSRRFAVRFAEDGQHFGF